MNVLVPTHASAKTFVAFTCNHSATINAENAAEVCEEFAAFLSNAYPTMVFQPDMIGKPKVELQITKANERSIGMEIAFTDVNGKKTAGIPLQMAFFDRNSDPQMRMRFYTEFMRQNPIPF